MTIGAPFTDPEDPIISLLADRIAERVAQKLGLQVADGIAPVEPTTAVSTYAPTRAKNRQLPAAATPSTGREGLWTAREVARHYSVHPSFVYQHADELGCVRLGGGKCPRLRFDPQVVRERWPRVGESLPAVSPQRPRSDRRTYGARRASQRGHELLDIDREP